MERIITLIFNNCLGALAGIALLMISSTNTNLVTGGKLLGTSRLLKLKINALDGGVGALRLDLDSLTYNFCLLLISSILKSVFCPFNS